MPDGKGEHLITLKKEFEAQKTQAAQLALMLGKYQSIEKAFEYESKSSGIF